MKSRFFLCLILNKRLYTRNEKKKARSHRSSKYLVLPFKNLSSSPLLSSTSFPFLLIHLHLVVYSKTKKKKFLFSFDLDFVFFFLFY